MKKLLHIAFVAMLIVPSLAFASFDTNLKYGSSGIAVKEMQEFLVSQGVCAVNPTGNFFALTLKCVQAFQRKQSILPVSGYWGPLTRIKASSLITADLSDSTADEQRQTGTITPPVISPIPVTDAQTQAKLDTLSTQIQNLQIEQKTVEPVKPPPPTDVCSNIPEIQTTVPDNMIADSGNCSYPIPEITFYKAPSSPVLNEDGTVRGFSTSRTLYVLRPNLSKATYLAKNGMDFMYLNIQYTVISDPYSQNDFELSYGNGTEVAIKLKTGVPIVPGKVHIYVNGVKYETKWGAVYDVTTSLDSGDLLIQ